MKIVTFLVPCYNVSDCVRHCLDSILSIASLHEKIEVLAINDGSKDNTLEILQEYKTQYPNAVKVLDKPNGGWGTVINMGIREAKGKYLKEIDADDWVESENLQAYIANLEQLEDCDFIATEYKDYMKATNTYIPHTYLPQCYKQLLPLGEFWEKYPKAWCFPIHAITYRTTFLREINLTVGDRFYTDIEYILFPLPYIKNLIALPLNITVYFHGSDEQSTGPLGYRKHYKNYLDLVKRLVIFSNNLPINTIQPIRQCLFDNIQGIINFSYKILLSPVYMGATDDIQKECKEYDDWIRINASEHYKASNRVKVKGIPYIKIWRLFRINILNFSKAQRHTR